MSPISLSLRNAVQVCQRHLSRFELTGARAVSMDSSYAGTNSDSRPTRWYANASTKSMHDNGNDHDNDSQDYNSSSSSPFDSLFQMIHEGKTSMGTTHLHRTAPQYLKCGVPEDALRFRTRHLGRLLEAPFINGDEHKVTVSVASYYLPLNDVEREILQQIVGPRLTQERLQLSSSQFGSRIENKRHLISILDRVVLEAKKIAEEMKQDASSVAPVASDDATENKQQQSDEAK